MEIYFNEELEKSQQQVILGQIGKTEKIVRQANKLETIN